MSSFFSEVLGPDNHNLADEVSSHFRDDPFVTLKKEKKKGKKKSKKIKKLSKMKKKQGKEIKRLNRLLESQKHQQTGSPFQNQQGDYLGKVLPTLLDIGLRQVVLSSRNPTIPIREEITYALPEGRDGDA